MKVIIYYLLLLVFIALVAGSLVLGRPQSMGMQQMLGISAALILYVIAMSFVGEGKNQDERQILHKNLSNRAGLVAGSVIFSLGILYQLFVSHNIDYWLWAGLIAINLTKIISLIFLENRN
ncbi:MAG: hypothetical protein P4L74_01655 [Candidatus Doudnabacteria bacterium]|nr:hypothetical protein [Candidatus Doudnabacteria bacterium]